MLGISSAFKLFKSQGKSKKKGCVNLPKLKSAKICQIRVIPILGTSSAFYQYAFYSPPTPPQSRLLDFLCFDRRDGYEY